MGKRVLITGATSGIGSALAHYYAGHADLLLAGRRPEQDIRRDVPADAAYVAADQSRPEQAATRIGKACESLGWDGLDLGILNAGTGYVGDPALEDPDRLRETVDTNLVAPIAIAHRLFPLLEAAGGQLVLVGSTAHRGAPAFASYAASKAGLDGFARALREEWRGRVGVQVIHPGPTRTGMHRKAGLEPRGERFFASPERMARLIAQAVETRRSPVTISFARYALAGGGR